ncbi:MAG: PLP-dependent aminotransferase family protein [Lachnospiraceae bacterium]|nr:PLP-dependent aminotransferase family protein [Lachnospiraceae bacterium]
MRDKKKQADGIRIDWKPEKKASEPLYLQIVNYFSKKIFSGDWVEGQSLPSQRRLSSLFSVNRSTIVDAMDELTSRGLIESNFGGGTRIAGNNWSLLMKGNPPDWQRYIREGSFSPNVPVVQIINHMEFEPGIIRMSTGELSPELMQTGITKRILSKLSKKDIYMNYPHPFGMPDLREVLRQELKGIGIDVPVNGILIVSGALQALQLISIGIMKPGSTAYIESPSYLRSLNIFRSAGVTQKSVPMDADGLQPWHIGQPENKQHNAVLYTIPTFQNPTGNVMSVKRRREVLRYCKNVRMPIVEDDVFCDLWLDEEPPAPMKAFDESGNVVYIGSLSKCFSPGLRVGWLAASEPVVQRLADVKMQMDYGVGVVAQQLTRELLLSGWYRKGIRTIQAGLRARRDLMMRLLARYFTGFAEWTSPPGGFFVWVRLKNRVPAERLAERALKENLLVMPGGTYGSSWSHCIRLTFGYLDEEQMTYGVKRLSEILAGMQSDG